MFHERTATDAPSLQGLLRLPLIFLLHAFCSFLAQIDLGKGKWGISVQKQFHGNPSKHYFSLVRSKVKVSMPFCEFLHVNYTFVHHFAF